MIEPGRPLDLCTVGHSEVACELDGDIADAPRLVFEAPEPLVEQDGFQLFIKHFESCLLVLVEEEPGVGEPRHEHLLVPPYHLGGVGRNGVGKDDEGASERAVFVLQGDVTLMPFHHVDQNGPGQLQVGRLIGAEEAVGIFRNVADLFQKVLIGDGAGACLCLDSANLCLHRAHPLRVVDDDAARLHLLRIEGGVRDGHLAARQEAVPHRRIPARYPRGVKMDDLAAEEGDDPMDGPAELKGAVSPAHFLLEGDAGDSFGKKTREDFHGRAALFDPFHADELGRLFSSDFQRRHVDALRPGKPNGRRRRQALRVKGALGRGAEFYRDALALLLLHVVDEAGEAPGRAVDPDSAEADAEGG